MTINIFQCLKQTFKPLRRKLRRARKACYVDIDSDSKNSILLVGDGRSGTTWVANIINYNNEYRYMFEPFHPHFIGCFNALKYFQYLRPIDHDKHFYNKVNSVLTGQFRHYYVDQFNHKFFCQKRLIKDIFSHLFLKWINVHFPGVPIILLLRHPCAVAISKQKLRHLKWFTEPRDFLTQETLVEDFLRPFANEIMSAKSFFERQIIIWCVVHYVVLKQFRKGEIHLTFYENLCEDPVQEIHRLFSFIGRHIMIQDGVFEMLKKPSELSRSDSPIKRGGNLIDEWKKHVTYKQMCRALEILNIFQLHTIYSDKSIPNVAGAYDMLRKR